ncbi:MAG: HD-GYP domain-containing protein [Armatimonadetes bacterium]|nr:HD-GYP domain-containing protein [Armatimonadota bacterium]
MNKEKYFFEALDALAALSNCASAKEIARTSLDLLLRVSGAEGGKITFFASRFHPALSVARNFSPAGEEEIMQALQSTGQPVIYFRAGHYLALPFKSKDGVLGAALLTRRDPAFTQQDLKYAGHLAFYGAICLERAKKQKQDFAILRSLAQMVDARDHHTKVHSLRVTRYALRIALRMALPRGLLEQLRVAALLHDIGKISVRDDILFKPGPLTAGEFACIRRHPAMGAKILGNHEELKAVTPLVLHHHERWDGKGYPDGLQGEEIPLGARIIAVADAFEAMTAHRPYRRALSRDEAVRELIKNAGTQFDSRIVETFLKCL